MKNFLTFILAFFLCFVPREGITSKIFYTDLEKSLSQLAQDSAYVVLAKPLEKTEIYRKELIEQKSLDGKPQEPAIYQEVVQLYEVIRDIKDDSTMAAGETIKVWTEPAYDYELTRMYIQDGISKSPFVQRYTPRQEPQVGENVILFLKDKDPSKFVYLFYAIEGVGLLPAIEVAVKSQPVADE